MKAAPASILGIGAVTPLGRDLQTIFRRLEEVPAAPVKRISDEILADPEFSKHLRRADRFARMAAIAAVDAWSAAREGGEWKVESRAEEEVSMDRVGLIVSSGLGPHGRGFKFLDGVLDCGDLEGLPTDFSHSVHAAAASYITGLLDLRGPSLSITDFEIGFENAVLLAQCWLERGVCDRVIVGAVEELGEVLIACARQMLGGKLGVGAGKAALGEGAVFLVLGPAEAGGKIKISVEEPVAGCDLVMVDDPAIPDQGPPPGAKRGQSFLPAFGHSASSSAFELLGGLLSMRYGEPRGGGVVDNATTFRTSCGQAIGLRIEKNM
jgi:hypothetical protein